MAVLEQNELKNFDDKEHLAALEEAAKEHGWSLIQDATMTMLDGSSLYELAYKYRHYQNYIFADDWEYVEVSFKTHGLVGLSRLKTKWVHYSVMRSKLPRKLPNIVFDSLEHQKRQFRIVFDSQQHIELEGDFNNYFAAYFGEDYDIDDLSFIAPEVMEALIVAKDYDIEIVHDSLLLFGPIQVDCERQVVQMSQDIELIRQKLLNNILAYRDERVPYNQGRHIVARAGMFLKQRPYYFITFKLIGYIFLLFLYVFLAILLLAFFNQHIK